MLGLVDFEVVPSATDAQDHRQQHQHHAQVTLFGGLRVRLLWVLRLGRGLRVRLGLRGGLWLLRRGVPPGLSGKGREVVQGHSVEEVDILAVLLPVYDEVEHLLVGGGDGEELLAILPGGVIRHRAGAVRRERAGFPLHARGAARIAARGAPRLGGASAAARGGLHRRGAARAGGGRRGRRGRRCRRGSGRRGGSGCGSGRRGGSGCGRRRRRGTGGGGPAGGVLLVRGVLVVGVLDLDRLALVARMVHRIDGHLLIGAVRIVLDAHVRRAVGEVGHPVAVDVDVLDTGKGVVRLHPQRLSIHPGPDSGGLPVKALNVAALVVGLAILVRHRDIDGAILADLHIGAVPGGEVVRQVQPAPVALHPGLDQLPAGAVYIRQADFNVRRLAIPAGRRQDGDGVLGLRGRRGGRALAGRQVQLADGTRPIHRAGGTLHRAGADRGGLLALAGGEVRHTDGTIRLGRALGAPYLAGTGGGGLRFLARAGGQVRRADRAILFHRALGALHFTGAGQGLPAVRRGLPGARADGGRPQQGDAQQAQADQQGQRPQQLILHRWAPPSAS